MKLQAVLLEGRDRGASDIHLSSGRLPMLRVHGELHTLAAPVMLDDEIREGISQVMPASHRARFEQSLDTCFAFEVAEECRFRAAVFVQQQGISAIFRPIPLQCPTLEDLGAPSVLCDLLLKPSGLILVTGPAGSGKTTALAAMVHHINTHQARHLVIIENPTEFIHPPQRSLIHQREIDRDARSFPSAIRATQFHNADVIVIGEMRDADTIRLALAAAESGHLVLGGVPTSGTSKTMERITDLFALQDREMIRAMLADSIEAVMSQVLCKRTNGPGQIAAHEFLVASTAIRNLIRDGKFTQMYSAIQSGGTLGMLTLDQSMAALVREGAIRIEEARERARFPDDFS